jgi:GT2 family glycosyltransferase
MNISCVILNYNDFETTLVLLGKIQDFSIIKHIVIVDNKSTDDSFQVLGKYANEKVHVIQTEKNGGYGYGNNFGIRYSYDNLKAEQIIIANPDVCFSEECVREMSETLRQCAVVSPMPYKQANSAWVIPTALRYLLATSRIANKLCGTIYYNYKYFEGERRCHVDCVAGSLLMVDAEKMLQYGMYDEDIFLFCEETVLGLKMKAAGLKTMRLPNTTYLHYHSVSINKSYPSILKRQKLLYASKLVVLKKYYGLKEMQILIVKAFFAYCNLEISCIEFLRRTLRMLKR